MDQDISAGEEPLPKDVWNGQAQVRKGDQKFAEGIWGESAEKVEVGQGGWGAEDGGKDHSGQL